MLKKIGMIVLASGLVFTACKKEKGCTDSKANNYSSSAQEDDGSCTYTTTTTPLLITLDGDTVVNKSPLHNIINKEYKMLTVNGVVDSTTRVIVFTDYRLGTNHYDVKDYQVISQTEWIPLNKVGTKFRYSALGKGSFDTWGAELYIDTNDSVTGEMLVTVHRNTTTQIDSIQFKEL